MREAGQRHKSNCLRDGVTAQHLSHSLECIMAGASAEASQLRVIIKLVGEVD